MDMKKGFILLSPPSCYRASKFCRGLDVILQTEYLTTVDEFQFYNEQPEAAISTTYKKLIRHQEAL